MSIDKIHSYFGFSKMPFDKDISPSELFQSVGHKQAIARIKYLIDSQAIGVITGEVGSGKTVAVRSAISTAEASKYSVTYISNPSMGTKGIYMQLVSSMGEEPKFFLSQLIAQTSQLIGRERSEKGKKMVVIFDEAHLLNGSQLEELRLLTNSNMDSTSPFALILIGQPALRQKLRLSTYAALEQRVMVKYQVPSMSYEETKDYTHHHLKICGRSDTLFSDDALALIHQESMGLPRSVNNYCRQSLIAAYSTQSAIVDEKSARCAIQESGSD